MNMPVLYIGYEATFASHYAEVRRRLRAPEYLEPRPIALLPPPAAPDIVPDQRGVVARRIKVLSEEAATTAALRALDVFASRRERYPGLNSVRQMQVAVAESFKVDLWAILGDSRYAGIVRIRHIAITLARRCCTSTLEDLSRRFARNHATVLYAERKMDHFLDGAACEVGVYDGR